MIAFARRRAAGIGAVLLVIVAATGFALTIEGQLDRAPRFVPAQGGPADFAPADPDLVQSDSTAPTGGRSTVAKPADTQVGLRPTARCARLVRDPASVRPIGLAAIHAVGHPDEMTGEWATTARSIAPETIAVQ